MLISTDHDILNMLTSLSNHEIFTPPDVVENMLNLLPDEVWTKPEYTFLDPCVKSGIFLRDIVYRLYQNLPETEYTHSDGTTYNLANKQERINHILRNQVYGIAISQLTAYMARRTVYGVMWANVSKEDEIAESQSISGNETDDSFIENLCLNDYFKPEVFNHLGEFSREGNIYYPDNEVTNENEDVFFPFVEKNEHTIINKIKEYKMKFDLVIGNPPYFGNSGIHQKFFNESVNIINENGYVCFIQPATVYINNKISSDLFNTDKSTMEMYENVCKYETEVEILPPSVFKGADVGTEISITLLKKKINNKIGFLKSVVYDGETKYFNVHIENVSITKINPEIYKNIKNKYLNFMKKTSLDGELPSGSLFDLSCIDGKSVVTKKNVVTAAKIAKIRGHRSQNGLKEDFFTFLSSKDLKENRKNTSHGIICEDYEIDNIHSYLMTKFARFGLTLFKFNQQNSTGELKGVPIVSFDRKWTDNELFKLIGLNESEIEVIEDFIPNWNHYGN